MNSTVGLFGITLLKLGNNGFTKKIHNISTFKEEFISSHIETNALQKTFLTVGSTIVSLLDPSRGDMIATLGETTGLGALSYMKKKMEESEEGQEILKDLPRINSRTVDLDYLHKLPNNTVGSTYYKFLETNVSIIYF